MTAENPKTVSRNGKIRVTVGADEQSNRKVIIDVVMAALAANGFQAKDLEGFSMEGTTELTSEPNLFQRLDAWFLSRFKSISNWVIEKPKAVWDSLSTSRGLITKVGLFVAFMASFLGYETFFAKSMNDSQVRIFGAAEAHLWTHIWISLGTILFGFLVQYLIFNQQFKYFHNRIDTDNSWHEDFNNPTTGGIVRLTICFLTWAFPTGVCGMIMLLILG